MNKESAACFEFKKKIWGVRYQEISINVFTCSSVGVTLAVDCSDKEDGVYEWGCDSFTRCVGGKVEIIDCTKAGLVYNPEKEMLHNLYTYIFLVTIIKIFVLYCIVY